MAESASFWKVAESRRPIARDGELLNEMREDKSLRRPTTTTTKTTTPTIQQIHKIPQLSPQNPLLQPPIKMGKHLHVTQTKDKVSLA